MGGPVTHIFNVAGSNFSVRNVTLRRVSQHAVQLQPDVDSVVIGNVHILDTGEQMVKVAYTPGNPGSSDNGVMEDCLLEYSAGVGPSTTLAALTPILPKTGLCGETPFEIFAAPAAVPRSMPFTSGPTRKTRSWNET